MLNHTIKIIPVFLALITLTGMSSSDRAQAKEHLQTFTTHDGYEIRGILSHPADVSLKRPGVLLIHGSGAVDMNMFIPAALTSDGKPHRMFAEIAEGLSDAIVYRYNKRGVLDQPEGPPKVDVAVALTGDVDNLVADAASALQVLLQDPHVDRDNIYLLGISEGSVIAPRVAQKVGGVKGLILLSSMGKNLKETLYYQYVTRQLAVSRLVDANDDGFLVAEEIAAYPGTHYQFPLIDRNGDQRLSFAELTAVLVDNFYRQEAANLGGTARKWFEQHYDLRPNYQELAQFPGPVLLLHGRIDAQTPLEDAYMIEAALKAAGNTNVVVEVFEGLGHGFAPHKGRGGIIPTVGPIDTRVIDKVADWLQVSGK